jgi:hypothetical protein
MPGLVGMLATAETQQLRLLLLSPPVVACITVPLLVCDAPGTFAVGGVPCVAEVLLLSYCECCWRPSDCFL